MVTFAPKPPPEPTIIMIGGAFSNGSHTSRYVWRLWSDGLIEENIGTGLNLVNAWRGWSVIPEEVFP